MSNIAEGPDGINISKNLAKPLELDNRTRMGQAKSYHINGSSSYQPLPAVVYTKKRATAGMVKNRIESAYAVGPTPGLADGTKASCAPRIIIWKETLFLE